MLVIRVKAPRKADDTIRRFPVPAAGNEVIRSNARRSVRARGHFLTDRAAVKVPFLVLNRDEKAWEMPSPKLAKVQFAV